MYESKLAGAFGISGIGGLGRNTTEPREDYPGPAPTFDPSLPGGPVPSGRFTETKEGPLLQALGSLMKGLEHQRIEIGSLGQTLAPILSPVDGGPAPGPERAVEPAKSDLMRCLEMVGTAIRSNTYLIEQLREMVRL